MESKRYRTLIVHARDKYSFILLFSVMLVGFFSYSPVFSLYTSSVTIESTGQILIPNINATSGSANDIQDAVDWVVAHGGIGNVYVPAGDFGFVIDPDNTHLNSIYGVLIPGGVNIIGQGTSSTTLRVTQEPPGGAFMFYVDGVNGLPLRISGITFIGWNFSVEGEPYTQGIAVQRATDYHIDHCSFVNFSSKAIEVMNNYLPHGANRGLIDHCNFDNPYKDDPNVTTTSPDGRKSWGYGIIVVGQKEWHDTDYYLGNYEGVNDIVYIEDNNFSRTRHAIASNGYAWYVARHNSFYEPRPEQFGIIDVHGFGPGGRGLESYNNSIFGCEYYWGGSGNWYSFGHAIRGGGGVIFNNDLIDLYCGISLEEEGVGQERVNDLWIWNNTMITENAPAGKGAGDEGTLIDDGGAFTEGVEYHLSQRPAYVPYPYPHPLTIEP